MTLRAIVEIAVDLNHMRNLDLIHQGVYRVNVSVFNIKNGHVGLLPLLLSASLQIPIWFRIMTEVSITTNQEPCVPNTILRIVKSSIDKTPSPAEPC